MQNFKYLVANKKDLEWGLTVSTVGLEDVRPGEEYPSKGHADGYYFKPERGRVLHEYQLLYILEGSGLFRSEHCGETTIKTGDFFILFPGEWHSYMPLKETGWKAYCIGFKGDNMDRRVNAGFLSVDNPIHHVGYSSEVGRLYSSAINVAAEEPAYVQQFLAGIVNHLLGMLYSLERTQTLKKGYGHADLIDKARNAIRQHLEDELSIHDVAQMIGMGYSNFRKLFKEYTGVSPALYQQDLRLQRAMDLLSATNMSVKEIAYKLHFESADYFSTKFKKKVGTTPSEFRRA
jgi:AraC-like DNA-binding protein